MMHRQLFQAACALLFGLFAHAAQSTTDEGVQIVHSADFIYLVRWTDPAPMDVFVSADPNTPLARMRLLARQNRQPPLTARIADIKRPYFALRAANGPLYRTAERSLPLAGGSNFRDLGGYPGTSGRHVRWGFLYRSAAMPKLTDADYAYLSALKIKTIVDLRSVDERQLSPTMWRAQPGAHIVAVDYPGAVMFDRLSGYNGPNRELITERLYADFPVLLKEEYKSLFHELLAHNVPLVINCSTGQDRTGIAVALILSALGAPRDVIYQDYLLSVSDRTPANEMADVNLEEYAATNAEARFLIAYRNYVQKTHGALDGAPKTQPLKDTRGRPLLQGTLERIERDYGSVENYLDRVLGVSARDIARLRALYLQ